MPYEPPNGISSFKAICTTTILSYCIVFFAALSAREGCGGFDLPKGLHLGASGPQPLGTFLLVLRVGSIPYRAKPPLAFTLPFIL
jgi:hypothetical protein